MPVSILTISKRAPVYHRDFFESSLIISVNISSGVVGDKNIEFTWRGIKIFFISASVVLDESVGENLACAEMTKLLYNASVNNYVHGKTRPSTFSLWGKLGGLLLP